jgi:hypothetical protein
MGKRRGQEGWVGVIAAWRASGQSLAAYCREHGIDYGSCQRWKHRLSAKASEPAGGGERLTLIPVGAFKQVLAGSVAVTIGEVRIELRGDFDVAVLRRAVAALSPQGTSC